MKVTTQSTDVLHYDGRSETWRAAYSSREPFGQRLNRRRDAVVAAVEQRLEGKRVRILDAGCGTGEVARRLRAAGHEVVALDVSRDMLKEARQLRPSDRPDSARAAYVQGSVRTLPLQSRSFDVVVCVGVMGHLMRRRSEGEVVDTAALTLRELARVLRPGGFIVVTAPNLIRIHWLLDPAQLRRALRHRRYVRRLEESHGGRDERRLVQREGTRRWTPWGWRRMLTREGFQIVGSSGVGFGPFSIFGRKVMSSERTVRLSERLERVAAVKPFNWFPAHLITTIVRRE
jgi:2-polyprenyl-3-methyl-5-hydroxy-6-metoxy-1,4-benzoquinol methylase